MQLASIQIKADHMHISYLTMTVSCKLQEEIPAFQWAFLKFCFRKTFQTQIDLLTDEANEMHLCASYIHLSRVETCW